MAKILIAGGSGLIGSRLKQIAQDKGHEVAILSRTKSQKPGVFHWDVAQQKIDPQALQFADTLVNLAGANLGDKKWTASRKEEILQSRLQATRFLFESVQQHKPDLKTYVGASAIGYYGAITSEKIYTEADAPATDFLGTTCARWEEQASAFAKAGIRSAIVRIGVVLSTQGGALPEMLATTNKGLGAPLGSGKQYMPWVHIDDVCRIFLHAIENPSVQGTFNGVAPQHINNADFSRQLAEVLNKPFFLPKVPAFALKMMFGQKTALFLEGSRIASEKITQTGFQFRFPNLKTALDDLLKKKNA